METVRSYSLDGVAAKIESPTLVVHGGAGSPRSTTRAASTNLCQKRIRS